MQDINQTFETWSLSKTPENMNRVLTSMSGDMDRAINTAGGKPSPLTRGFAKNAVIKSMNSFNPQSGTQFRSWANTQLRSLVRPVRGSKFTVKVPELRARQSAKVRNIIDEIQAETGFEPSDATIADLLAIPMSQVNSARSGTSPEVVGEDIYTRKEPEDDTALIRDMVYFSLPPRDQTIMEYAFGYNGVKVIPSMEIAKRLKVTPAAISQRLALIRRQMLTAEEAV